MADKKAVVRPSPASEPCPSLSPARASRRPATCARPTPASPSPSRLGSSRQTNTRSVYADSGCSPCIVQVVNALHHLQSSFKELAKAQKEAAKAIEQYAHELDESKNPQAVLAQFPSLFGDLGEFVPAPAAGKRGKKVRCRRRPP